MYKWLEKIRWILDSASRQPCPLKLQALSFIRDVEPGITEMWYTECQYWSKPGNVMRAKFKNLSSRQASLLEEGEVTTVWYSEIPRTGYWKIHRVEDNATDDRDPSERG